MKTGKCVEVFQLRIQQFYKKKNGLQWKNCPEVSYEIVLDDIYYEYIIKCNIF